MQLSNPKLVVSSFLVLLVVGLVKSDLNSGVEDDETSLDSQLSDTSLDQKDDTFNSPPKKHEDKLEEPEGKLQIGIKKKADSCKHRAQKGDTLHMHYRGYLKKDGIEFDNSYKRGQPFTFTLGTGSVIRGWDQGLLGTCAGEKRKLVIPPHLAYGVEGNSGIPPESTLIFEVETIKVESSRGQEL